LLHQNNSIKYAKKCTSIHQHCTITFPIFNLCMMYCGKWYGQEGWKHCKRENCTFTGGGCVGNLDCRRLKSISSPPSSLHASFNNGSPISRTTLKLTFLLFHERRLRMEVCGREWSEYEEDGLSINFGIGSKLGKLFVTQSFPTTFSRV